jgi:hypothetical protein
MYNKYNKVTMQYWGTTEELNDDPTCEYVLDTDFPLPGYDNFSERLLWTGNGWYVVSPDTP